MKTYKPKKRNMFFFTIFSLFAFSVNALLLSAALTAWQTEGITKRSVFSSVFFCVILSLTVGFLKIYRKVMMVSYEISHEALIIRRGKHLKKIKFHEIYNVKFENHKITFQDINGEHYSIPSDFEDTDELYMELVSKKSIT